MKHRTPTLMDMLSGLISTPSISSVSPQFDMPNQPLAEKIGNWLADLGFAVEVQAVPGHPGKANVIGSLGRGPGGLVLAGHTDTVPYDQGGWQSDPFKLSEHDGRLYGLGMSDMKSFFAFALEAAARYRDADLSQPLIILGTADEESTMAGARALVNAGHPRARYAVIGEPTGLRPVRMHKGILMEAIKVRGHSGHSSDPALGDNALEGMHKVLAELLRFRDDLQAENRNPAFGVPVPTLNLGHIHGGDNPNRICADCELHIDIRMLPGMDLDELREAMQARVRASLAETPYAVDFHSLFEGVQALETPATAEIVRAAEKLTGHAAEAVAFSTEGAFFQALGAETLILGPGDIRQAHQPDEYLSLDTVQPTLDVLCGLIERFCVAELPTAVAAAD